MGRMDLAWSSRANFKWTPTRGSGFSFGARRFRKAIVVICGIALVTWMFHPYRHACWSFSFVPAEKIPDDVVPIYRHIGSRESFPPCSLTNDEELPAVPQEPWTITAEDLGLLLSRFDISPGGHGRPTAACQPQVKVALVVPYRDRPDQLDAFLWYMHHFLSMQFLDYTIVIVEQSPKQPFNRAKLFNVGFVEALAMDNQLDCFIFHDVDLLPENLLNVYGCSHQPRHLISSLNTFRYTMQSCDMFGGATAIRKEQFKKVNGFANRFFGWGAEDDDFRERVLAMNFSMHRWDPKVARYTMMIHPKAAANPNRLTLLENYDYYLESDGLTTLSYERLKLEKLSLYTRILVDL